MDNDLELVTLEEPTELQEKLQPIFAAAVTNSPGISCVQRLPPCFLKNRWMNLRRAFLKNPRANTSTMLDYLSPVIVRRR